MHRGGCLQRRPASTIPPDICRLHAGRIETTALGLTSCVINDPLILQQAPLHRKILPLSSLVLIYSSCAATAQPYAASSSVVLIGHRRSVFNEGTRVRRLLDRCPSSLFWFGFDLTKIWDKWCVCFLHKWTKILLLSCVVWWMVVWVLWMAASVGQYNNHWTGCPEICHTSGYQVNNFGDYLMFSLRPSSV